MDDDIDNYFDNDLVLDEQTLAILDREEKKYFQTQRPAPPTAFPPAVTKKQKTRDGWSPGLGSQSREHDFNDLPEISVAVDGNYGFADSALTATSSNPNKSLPKQHTQSIVAQSQRQKDTDGHISSHVPSVPPPRRVMPTVHHRTTHTPNLFRQQKSTGALLRDTNCTSSQPDLEKQIAELQAQLLQVRNENQKIQSALKEATGIRHAKEGEVSILHKNIEKIAQNHAAEIVKMKAVREEADCRQKQTERQLKEEMERIKTQFLFKQHELETALRRPPSARVPKVMRNIPATPVRVPSQISAWNAAQNVTSGQIDGGTPREEIVLRLSPRAARIGQMPPEIMKKSAFLPGFQNSFAATPLKLGTKADHKGKAKDLARVGSPEILDQGASPRAKPLIATPFHQRPVDNQDSGDTFDIIPTSDDLALHIDEDGDTTMLEDAIGEELEPIENLSNKAELSRIILTHAYMKANETTFRLLVGLSFVANLPDAKARECAQAAQAILLALSHLADNSDYEFCSQQVAKYLIVMLRCIAPFSCCLPIAALLNLLRSMILSLPAFRKIILLQKVGDDEISSLFVTLLDLLEGLSVIPRDATEAPSEEVLFLLEVLLSDIPDETINQLALIPKRITTLLALLTVPQSHKSHNLLEILSRVFLLLAVYPSIHEQLSSSPEDCSREDEVDHRESPFLYQLCIFLLENFNGNFTQTSVTHSNLLACLAQLSLTQAEKLVNSRIVVPTLVYLIAQLSIFLWNDDECNLSQLEASSIIRTINQGLFLLHHLVRSSETTMHLHDKLLHFPHRNLNNVEYLFIISFGQLSYADPPSWISAEGKAELEYLANIARDLLDLVVDGPEGDSVWAAYQMEPDNASETDDEEREARLMDNDM